MELCLRHKIFIIAGGASATGTAICTELEHEGAIPIIIDLKKGRTFTIQADLTDEDACKEAVAIITKNFRRIHGVVNCIRDGDMLLRETLPWLKDTRGMVLNVTRLAPGESGVGTYAEDMDNGATSEWASELEGSGVKVFGVLASPGAKLAGTIAFILSGRGGLTSGELIQVEAIPEDSQFD